MASFSNNQINSMSYRELQKECKNAGMSAAGKTQALRKRLRGLSIAAPNDVAGDNDGGKPSPKRQKKANGKKPENAETIFQDIADEDDDQVAGMEGISNLCEKLNIDPCEDVRVLVLLWKMGAKDKPSQISKQEWMQGCSKLQVDSIAKIKAILPSLDTGSLDKSDFKDFYKFCFQFNRQGANRALDKELAVALLKMVVKGRIPQDRLESFCDFVESQESYTRITLDQWTSFLDFCYKYEDLSAYDESGSAWPVLIDEYVEHMEEKQKNKK